MAKQGTDWPLLSIVIHFFNSPNLWLETPEGQQETMPKRSNCGGSL